MGWLPDDKYYLDRGTFVHQAISMYLSGTLDESSLSEGVKPFVDSAIEYITVSGYKPKHVELSLHSPLFRYCGTLDAWPLLDWKTGGKEAWHVIQMSAYFFLAHENEITSFPMPMPLNVHLKNDGKLPKSEPYTLAQLLEAKKIFLSAIACYQWRKQHKLIKEKSE